MTESAVSPLARIAAQGQPAPGSAAELALATIETLSGLSAQLRQSAADALWASIAAVVEEPTYSPSSSDGFVLAGIPRFSDLVRIDRVLVSVPAGCTGTLRLGTETVIPNISAGVVSLPMTKILGPGDQRTLTIKGTPTDAIGACSLSLFGVQLAPTGSLAP